MKTTLEIIKTILAAQLSITEFEMEPDSCLVDDLGADELDAVEIAMSIEDQWNIEVPDEDFAKVKTVADAVKLVDSIISANKQIT